jgi:hypothetical protein
MCKSFFLKKVKISNSIGKTIKKFGGTWAILTMWLYLWTCIELELDMFGVARKLVKMWFTCAKIKS